MGTQSIVVEHDLASVHVFIDALAREAIKKAVATSIRRTFVTLKKEVASAITKRKLVNTRTLPQRVIKEKYIRETQNISAAMPIGDMQARLDFSGKKIQLMHFWAKRIPVFLPPKGKQKRGARAMGFGRNALSSVQVTIMGKTEIAVGGAAFMPGTTGTRTVFVRTTKHRTPLRIPVGPSFATMFDKLDLSESLQASAQARYRAEFDHQFEFYLKQLTDKQLSKSQK